MIMATAGNTFEVPIAQVERSLRRLGTRWFSVTARTQHALLDWAPAEGVPIKFFKGGRFTLPESMRAGLKFLTNG
jgi:hypothetical protein